MELTVPMGDHSYNPGKNVLAVDQIVREVLTGYCRDLPAEVVERVIAMHKKYGELAAMEAAVIAVKTREIVKQF